MGDLKVSETFLACVAITNNATGALETGLTPTCSFYNVNTGGSTVGTVSEIGATGLYKCTDFIPNAATAWLTVWAVAGAFTIHYPFQLFKVGGGTVEDLATRLTAARGGYLDNINQAGLLQITAVRAALLDNLDAAITTRAASATALSTATWTGARAGYLDELDFDLTARLGTPVGASISADILTLTGYTAIGSGTFTTSSATVPADTGQGGKATNYWRGCLLMPLTGVCAFQPRLIRIFTTGTGVFALDDNTPFTAAPGLVSYVILTNQETLVAAVDSAYNLQPSHVIGNKVDAATSVVGNTGSLIAYAKGILNELANGTYGLSALETLVDGIETRTNNNINTRTWFSPSQISVTVTAAAPNLALPSVVLPNIAGTIVAVYAGFKFRMVENTNAGANKLDTTQYIQVQKAAGALTNCIQLVDDQFGVAATTREGGDCIIGNIEVAATVDVFNATYNFQWTAADADLASLVFNDVQTFLIVSYY